MWSNSRGQALAALLLVSAAPAGAVEDLRALEVVGQRGQSQEQARRDRYECHHWAVGQAGAAPLAAPAQEAQAQAAAADVRRKRIDRALLGAAIGAGIGGLVGYDHRGDAGGNVVVGAAAGAMIGAATVRKPREEGAEAEGPSDYLRALTACLEGRGYAVRMPSAPVTAPAAE
jgi:hypothetical protein